MDIRYCSLNKVAKTLKKRTEQEDEGRIKVVKSDSIICDADESEMRDRNLYSIVEAVCYIKYSSDERSSRIKLTITFHESKIEKGFKFYKSGGEYTSFKNLSESFETVNTELTGLGIMEPMFVTLQSGSLSGYPNDAYADREFTYETEWYKGDNQL